MTIHATKKEVLKFRTPWTPDMLRNFRKKTGLIQADLAFLLNTTQQRVNEWEQGRHSMKRAYTALMNDLENKLLALRRRCGTNTKKYEELMLKEYGIEVKAWK